MFNPPQQVGQNPQVIMMDFQPPSDDHIIPRNTSGLHIEFFSASVKDYQATREAGGRHIFKNECFVKVTIAGDTTQSVIQRVEEHHKGMYPRHWEAFEKGLDLSKIEGTPIQEWPQITTSEAMTLRAANVHSVEQLANLTDENVTGIIMGGHALRSRAKAWLKLQKDNAEPLRLMEENNSLLSEMSQMRAELESLRTQLGQAKAATQAVMANAGVHAPTEAQLGQISQVGNPNIAPSPDLVRSLTEVTGVQEVSMVVPQMPGAIQPNMPSNMPQVTAPAGLPELQENSRPIELA